MKKILITAYDVDPYRGSESATGWNYSFELSKLNSVTVVTRVNNRSNIESYLSNLDGDVNRNITFWYFDLPKWASFWKRGERGAMPYFYLWQLFVAFFLVRRRHAFDVVHSLNFHCDWIPTFLWVLGKPLVWGPLSHHESIPEKFIENYSYSFRFKERLKYCIKQYFWKLDPLIKVAKYKSDIIIAGHSKVIDRLSLDEKRTVLLNQVASDDLQVRSSANSSKKFRLVFVGRLVPLKGLDVLIPSFIKFIQKLDESKRNGVELTIVGDGPCREKYEELVSSSGYGKNFNFLGWIDKEDVKTILQESKAFTFPSHEGAGMVVAEALSASLPVVCLDNYGPGEIVTNESAIKVPVRCPNDCIIQMSEAYLQLFNNEFQLREMSIAARELYERSYTWKSKAEIIDRIYESVLEKSLNDG